MYSPKQRGDIYRAIIEYVYYGIEPDWLKGEAMGFFIAIKPSLDKSKARSDAGRKGGKSQKQTAKQNGSKPQSKTEANGEAKRKKSESKEKYKGIGLGTTQPNPIPTENDEANAGRSPFSGKLTCPECGSPMWKDTQGGSWHCDNCFTVVRRDGTVA